MIIAESAVLIKSKNSLVLWRPSEEVVGDVSVVVWL